MAQNRKHLQTHCRCGQPVRPKQRNCRECHNAAMRKHRSLHPMTDAQRKKDNARSYASQYLKRGLIDREPCLLCGAKAEMHHPDYNKPLDVMWLCRPHHLDLHAGRIVILAKPIQPTVKPSSFAVRRAA